jgi:hypothetical protein
MIKKLLYLLLLFLWVKFAQGQESETPFKKGLWLTSLDGSISSANSSLGRNNNANYNTAYGFNVSSNKIFKDRWAAGLRLSAARASSNSVIEREAESIFIGPGMTYFFSQTAQGSLFMEFAPGYVRFFESSKTNSGAISASETVDGNGFGTVLRFGYAHAINEKILLPTVYLLEA